MDKQNDQAKNFKLVFEENVIDYDLKISSAQFVIMIFHILALLTIEEL